jgi:hypothetical protein
VGDRIKHFRAGLLLALSSTIVVWPISYWFPLSDYLASIDVEDYADYKQSLQFIISIYLMFFFLNLITAGLSATKISHRLKFWLSLVPAAMLLVLPFAVVIPIALKFPEQGFFEVFQALYSLLRFNSPQLLWWVLVLTVLSVGLNVLAALVFKKATNPELVPRHLGNRYLIYVGVLLLAFAATVLVSTTNASIRASDRKACLDYSILSLPEFDNQVDAYISNLRTLAEQTGSKNLQTQFVEFSDTSREYLSLVVTTPDNSEKLAQYGESLSAVKGKIDIICSEFSVS